MSEALSFVEFLFELGAEELELSRSDATLAVAIVGLGDRRRLLAIERTYRAGVKIIFDPAEKEVQIARDGNLWDLWNSDRARHVDSMA